MAAVGKCLRPYGLSDDNIFAQSLSTNSFTFLHQNKASLWFVIEESL